MGAEGLKARLLMVDGGGGLEEGAGRSGAVQEIRQTWGGGATDLALNRRLN